MFAPPPPSSPTSRDPARGLTVLSLALAVAVFTWRCLPTWSSTVDDAWISARYARMLADGHGLTYSTDAPAMEGITNLAWTLLLAVAHLVGAPIQGTLTGLGWLFGVGALLLAPALSRALSERPTPLHTLAAWLLAFSPDLAVASTNGLESSMMVFAVLLALWAHLTDTHPWRLRSGAAIALLLLTRPEGAAVAGLLVLHAAWRHRTELSRALPTAGWVFGGLAALTAARLAVYGMPLPNTFYAKQAFNLTDTFKVNARYLTPNQTTLYAILGAWALGSLAPPWRASRALVAASGLALGVIPLTVELWMPGLRLFLPTLAIATALLASACASVRLSIGVPAALAMGVASVTLGVQEQDRVRAYDARHSVEPDNDAALMAQWLSTLLPPGATLATRDAGVFAYHIGTHVHVAELHHRALTRPHPDGAHADVRAYTPTNPEVIVVTQREKRTEGFVYSNDRGILQRTTEPYRYKGRVHQHYRRYYDVYVRADVDADLPDPRMVVSHAGPPPPHLADEAADPRPRSAPPDDEPSDTDG